MPDDDVMVVREVYVLPNSSTNIAMEMAYLENYQANNPNKNNNDRNNNRNDVYFQPATGYYG